MEIRSLKALEKHLKEQIQDVLQNEVLEQVRKTELEAIDDIVYGAGTPKVYQRRKNDLGLSDPGNMIPLMTDDGMTLQVHNMTAFNKEYGTENQGMGLDELVEYGDGGGGFQYDYGLGWWSHARPFTQETIDRLNNSKEHLDQLWAGLRRRGIHVK